MNVLSPELLIGQVSAESGISIKTIRFYEQQALISSVGRTAGGFRRFSPDVLSRLTFIKRAQSLGMSLEEIREFLQVHDQGSYPCDRIRSHLQAKIAEIDQRIRQLQSLKEQMSSLLSGWEQPTEWSGQIICPNLEVDPGIHV